MRKHPPQRRGGSLVAKGKAAGRAPARRSRLKRELRKKASAEAERAANGPVQTRSSHVLRTRKERTNAPFDSREVHRSYRSSAYADRKSCFFSEFFPLLTTVQSEQGCAPS